MHDQKVQYPPVIYEKRRIFSEPFLLTPQDADKRGQTSENRLHQLLSNRDHYPWIEQVQLAKKCQPAYDISVQLASRHTLAQRLKIDNILLDAKSSQRQIIEYTTRHNSSDSNWRWVLHCGSSLNNDEINAQIVLYLLLTAGIYEDRSRWHLLFDHLHTQLVKDFENDYSTLCYWGYPIINWMSKRPEEITRSLLAA